MYTLFLVDEMLNEEIVADCSQTLNDVTELIILNFNVLHESSLKVKINPLHPFITLNVFVQILVV